MLEGPRSRQAQTEPEGVVRLEGPSGARLEREIDSVTHDWEIVCTAPCVAHTPTAFDYRVTGGGLRPSQGFPLRVDSAENLRVHGAWLDLYVLGWVGVGTGGVATLTALTLELMQTRAFGVPPPFKDPDLGWLAFGAGTAALVGGLALVLTNKHTTVSQDVVDAAGAPVPSTAAPAPAAQLTTAEASARFLRAAPAFGVRVVSLRF